jgi:hypothetical protein
MHAPNLCPSEQFADESLIGRPPPPYGWDSLFQYFAAHYSCHSSSLKYYSSGTNSVHYGHLKPDTVTSVSPDSRVHQGNSLGSTLFALGIHPILLPLILDASTKGFWCPLTQTMLSWLGHSVPSSHADYCLRCQAPRAPRQWALPFMHGSLTSIPLLDSKLRNPSMPRSSNNSYHNCLLPQY